jgi:hypothetical protein
MHIDQTLTDDADILRRAVRQDPFTCQHSKPAGLECKCTYQERNIQTI